MLAAIRLHSASTKSRTRICDSVSGRVIALDFAMTKGMGGSAFGIGTYSSLIAQYRDHAGHWMGIDLCKRPT
jgi:hypothetical protein